MQLPKADFSVEELICNESFQEYCLGYSLENRILWDEWIETMPHKRADFDEALRLVNILNVKQGSRIGQLKELRGALKQKDILSRSISLKSDPVIVPEDKRRSIPYYRYISAVAAILLIASVYLYLNPFSGPVLVKPEFSERFSSGTALRKTVILDDGSVVTLSKESTIKLQKDFNKSTRELWLNGEAFFDVKHDAAHPFIIHTSFNDIKVLGTTFNVKAYSDNKAMETSLIRGSVRVESTKYPGYFVVLKPNEKLVFDNVPKKDSITSIASEYHISRLKSSASAMPPKETQWVRKRLDIDDLPLSAIAQKLQDWYGIEIFIADEEVKKYRYSGVFENETIVKTLEALQLSYPFEFTIQHHKIIIKK